MDENTLIIFKTDINAQMELIKKINQTLNNRSIGLTGDDLIRLESVAYQIHNLYSAVEDLLKIVATYFENNITETAKFHIALLTRMTQTIPSIRPALISQETFSILNSLRGFRHFFRHAYGTPIEYEQLKNNLDKSLNLLPILEQDVNTFLEKICQR
ncbi:ribonuclease toxin HepT-like protein [Crocosphaera sp. Alani8]|uniref:ribonuclease toxin HepT-like protein n=1 Tax=Crocosphaera sp. Alani8 TaxID=3038952 RepID=UPI00313DECD9